MERIIHTIRDLQYTLWFYKCRLTSVPSYPEDIAWGKQWRIQHGSTAGKMCMMCSKFQSNPWQPAYPGKPATGRPLMHTVVGCRYGRCECHLRCFFPTRVSPRVWQIMSTGLPVWTRRLGWKWGPAETYPIGKNWGTRTQGFKAHSADPTTSQPIVTELRHLPCTSDAAGMEMANVVGGSACESNTRWFPPSGIETQRWKK